MWSVHCEFSSVWKSLLGTVSPFVRTSSAPHGDKVKKIQVMMILELITTHYITLSAIQFYFSFHKGAVQCVQALWNLVLFCFSMTFSLLWPTQTTTSIFVLWRFLSRFNEIQHVSLHSPGKLGGWASVAGADWWRKDHIAYLCIIICKWKYDCFFKFMYFLHQHRFIWGAWVVCSCVFH